MERGALFKYSLMHFNAAWHTVSTKDILFLLFLIMQKVTSLANASHAWKEPQLPSLHIQLLFGNADARQPRMVTVSFCWGLASTFEPSYKWPGKAGCKDNWLPTQCLSHFWGEFTCYVQMLDSGDTSKGCGWFDCFLPCLCLKKAFLSSCSDVLYQCSENQKDIRPQMWKIYEIIWRTPPLPILTLSWDFGGFVCFAFLK